MADIARHTQWGVSINGVIESAIVENSVSVSSNIQKAVLYAGGDIFPTLGATMTCAPTIQFRTRNINLVTAPAALSSTGVIIACRAYADGGGPGTAYISLAIAKGLIVPMSISGSIGQPAELTVNVYGISTDGDSAPIAVGTTTAALGVHGDAHTAATVTVGTAIGGIQNINLNFGYSVKTNEGENGKSYPTLAYYDRQQAVLTASTTALAAATAARMTTAQSAAVSATFRKMQEAAVLTDTGAITITMAKAIIEAQSVQSGMPYTVQLATTPIYDGAGDDYLTFS
jgi:hypothetical protein